MAHACGSGSAAVRGKNSAPSPYRFGYVRADCLRPFGVSRHRLWTGPVPPHPIFHSYGGRALFVGSASGQAGSGTDGARDSFGDAAGAGSRAWQQRGGGSRSSYRWTSTSTATGSFRGSYEDFGEPQDGEGQDAESKELGGPVKRLMALGTAATLELLLTGSLVWTPLAAAAVALVLIPGARALNTMQAAARQAEAVAAAEARVRAEMASRVPVSPPESATWVGRMLGELWEPYVAPLVLSENLGHWADKVRRAAPAGLDVQLVEMSLGREAPRLSNFQVHADPNTGRVTSIDCNMSFESSSMRIVVIGGSGPMGRFTATITGINMRGRMRLIPIPDQRIILFSFREPPSIDPKLTLEGPFLGSRDIPPTALLRSLLAATLQDCLVEPVRGAISLDPEMVVGQPVDTTINIYVESVQGITNDGSPAAAGAAASGGMAGAPPTTAGPYTPPSLMPPQHQQPLQPQQHMDDPSLAAFLASLATGPSPQSAVQSAGGAGGGNSTASVVAAASNAAVAASEAVAEGAGAIASLVPGLSSVAGGAPVEGGGKGARRRMLQVVAINTDSKLQRETRPVAYTPYKPPATTSNGTAGPASVKGVGVAPGAVVPVLQMLKLNVGHKDTIYKLLVKDVGRSGGAVNPTGGAPTGTGGGPAASASSSGASTPSTGSTSVASSSGSMSAASSTPTSVAAAMVSGLPTPGLLGSVRLHVAAAKDGSTLFWAAKEGGEPVAVRWRPSDGPWRVTLPLESPTSGLPPPPLASQVAAAAAAVKPAGSTLGKEGAAPPLTTGGTTVTSSGGGGGAGAADAHGNGVNSSSSGSDGSGRATDRPTAPMAAGQTGSSGAATGRTAYAANTTAQPAATALRAAHDVSHTDTAAPTIGPDTPAAGTATGADMYDTGASARPNVAAGPASAIGQSAAVVPVGGPSITLLVSAEPWVYADASPHRDAYGSPRSRSLVLQVVEARDLAARDWAGTCDPYVRISYDNRTYRTRTLYNAHTPVWQQTFILPDNRFALSPNSPPRNRMSLSVYDSGVSRDDRLGSATLNLEMASEHQLQDRWLPLQGAESGWLRVRLAAVPDAPDSAAVRRAVEALAGLTRGSGPLLQVVVLSVRALSPRRGGQLLGLRDAYCNIVYGGARHVTPVVRQNQNPRWDYSALFAMQPDEDVVVAGADSLRDQRVAEHVKEDASAPPHQAMTTISSTKNGGSSSSSSSSNTTTTGRSNGSSNGSAMAPPSLPQQPADVSQDSNSHVQQNAAAASPSSTNGRPGQDATVGDSGGSGGRPLSMPPYPSVPGGATAPPRPPPTEQAEEKAWQRPRPRFRRDRNRDILRLEVKDVAPVPPDEDLGWVELPVRALLPEPGDSWQGWLPLRRGEGAEILVRISRIQPLPLGQGAQRLPQEQPQRGGATTASEAASPTVAVSPVGGGVGGDAGVTAGSSAQQGVALMERVLLDSFTDQVRAANRAAGLMGDDLRVRLGQDVIPKLQDWWDAALQRTVTTLETPGSQLGVWLRNQQLLPSAWMAGINAMSGKAPPEARKALLAPPAAASGPLKVQGEPAQDTSVAKDAADVKGKSKRSSAPKRSEQETRERGAPGSGSGGSVVEAAAADSASSDDSKAAQTDGGGAPVSEEAQQSGGGKRVSAKVGDGVLGKEAGGRKWVGGGDRNTKVDVSKAPAVSGGGLGQLLARAWEQLLGPPAYQPGGQAEVRSQDAQKEPLQRLQLQGGDQQHHAVQQGPHEAAGQSHGEDQEQANQSRQQQGSGQEHVVEHERSSPPKADPEGQAQQGRPQRR